MQVTIKNTEDETVKKYYSLFGKKLKKKIITKTVGSSTYKKIFHYDSNESIVQINNLTDGYVKKK